MARRRGPLFYFIWFLGVFLVGTVIVLSSITYYLSIDPSAYLSDDEVPILSGHERWNASDHGQVERIPRILHQTWRTEQLPPRWKGISQECRDMMPDYEYMLWTDESSRDFIAEHYPWFLDTFTDYTYAIQRADAIRYFILYHYGGVYLDLDIGCIRPLDPLLTYSVILPKTIPVGVSNDLMFAEPRHPFLAQTIHNLVTFDHSWILNYPTVMFSTGPMFLSLQYGLFTSSHAATPIDPIRILPKSLYGKNAKEGEAPHSFFSHFYGSSWHADDAAFIGFLGHWGKGLMWLGLIIMIIGIVRILLPGKQRRGLRSRGYEVLFPRWSSSTGRLHLHLGRSALLSDSDSSTRPPSPDSTMPSPSGSELYLPLDVPPSPSFRDWQSEQFAGRVSTPIVQAFRRVRNRVTSTITGHHEHELPEEPDTPIRPRRHGRGHSRGVLFFLPAIFAPTPDLEGGGASQPYGPPPDIPLLSRRPPEKYNPYEDGEEVLFDSNASETGTLVDHGGSSSRPHSRTAP